MLSPRDGASDDDAMLMGLRGATTSPCSMNTSSSSTCSLNTSSSSTSSVLSGAEPLEYDFDGDLDTRANEFSPTHRRPLEYWAPEGRCLTYSEISKLLEFADNPTYEVRRRPVPPRATNVQFPFDVYAERQRLRLLMFDNRKLVKRLAKEVIHAMCDGTDRLEYDMLTPTQIELVRALACIAGIETHARCRPSETTCTAFLPRGAFHSSVRCGCAYTPIEVHRSTALHLKRMSPKIEADSADERAVLAREHCASISDSRRLYFGATIVDGIVLLLERRTPRTPRPLSEEPLPRVQIANDQLSTPARARSLRAVSDEQK